MSQEINIIVYGSLKRAGEGPRTLELESPTPLAEVIRRLDLPDERLQLAMVNHRAVPWESTISPGDRLALFPKEYPLFVDWKDYRARPATVDSA